MKRKQTAAQLSRRAQRIILALLEQPTQEKAAQAAGVSKATLWRWQQKPEFQRAWLEMHRRILPGFARLQQAAPAAATTSMRVIHPSTSKSTAAGSGRRPELFGKQDGGIEAQALHCASR